MRFIPGICLALLLVACSDRTVHYAPVTELSFIDPIPQGGVHRVKQGETLYEIAWRYGLDYRQVALRNNIFLPYAIYSGQSLYVSSKKIKQRHVIKQDIRSKQQQAVMEGNAVNAGQEPNATITQWVWPTKGSIIHAYSPAFKGINIGGNLNQPIYAAAAGKVVYCGDGLKRYGQLIIIKHNNLYLSAYAHNRTTLVKEGDWVAQGQQIAEMGDTGTDRVMLHFEIRRAGQAVNPIPLLKS